MLPPHARPYARGCRKKFFRPAAAKPLYFESAAKHRSLAGPITYLRVRILLHKTLFLWIIRDGPVGAGLGTPLTGTEAFRSQLLCCCGAWENSKHKVSLTKMQRISRRVSLNMATFLIPAIWRSYELPDDPLGAHFLNCCPFCCYHYPLPLCVALAPFIYIHSAFPF